MKCELLYSLCTVEKRKKYESLFIRIQISMHLIYKKLEEKETSFDCHICIYLFYRYFCAFYFYENSIESYTNAKPSWSVLNHTTNTVEVLSIKCKCHFGWKKNHIAANMNLNPEIHIKLQCENLMQRYSILTARFCRLHR